MKYGLLAFLTETALRPSELAVEAEERGYDSLWVPDHSHIPVSRVSAWVAGELPSEYCHLLDPFCALMEAAGATSTLKLGTGVCLVAQRDPIELAKQVATIDYLSGGRFLFGMGYGWNAEEMRNHGVDPRRRRAVLREKALAMKSLWSDDEAAFDGEHVHIEPSWCWPKPVQRPHPPILIGAKGPTAYRHVAEFADGWLPAAGLNAERLALLGAEMEKRGRRVADLDITIFGPSIDRLDRAFIERQRAAGVNRIVLQPATTTRDELLSTLDDLDRLRKALA